MKNIFAMVFLSTLCACGGGGGGSSTPFYGGVWDVSTVKVLDDCNLGSFPLLFKTVLTVNQDGTKVVGDVGQVVLTGSTNDKDGFDVKGPVISSSSCNSFAGYNFEGASDGEADVVIAIVLQCGSKQCSIGFTGTATKRNSKSALISQDMDNSLSDLIEGAYGILRSDGRVSDRDQGSGD